MTDEAIQKYTGTAMVKADAASTAILDERHITSCLQQLDIADDEVAGYRKALQACKNADDAAKIEKETTAITEYRQKTTRIGRLFRRKFTPEIELVKSPKTQLLETIVQTADALETGLQTYKSLPEDVKRIKKDYAELCARRDKLYEQLVEFREFIEAGSEATESLVAKIRQYASMESEEREKLMTELQATYGLRHVRKINFSDSQVRETISAAIESECASRKEQIAVMLFPMTRDSYLSVLGQIKSTETQLGRIRASVVPAFLAFNKQRELYSALKMYTANTNIELVLAQMAAKAVELNKSAEEAVADRERELDIAKAMATDLERVNEGLFGTYKPTGDLKDVKKEIDRLIEMGKTPEEDDIIVEVAPAERAM